ncbi:MAG: NUDIX domain-containing protein [Aeromicrobium sp.]|uniref:NUDIX hydrolase n=1 Tax=Aeromicrobium sp. TaxID=1871063 RepID=UPI0039E688D8
MGRERTIVAAGGVVWRPRAGSRTGVEVLLVHRQRYDDWTFPKGKQDPGEPVQQTAVREIVEETGMRVRLGTPLPEVHYRVGAGPKVVHYWTARLDPADPGAFTPNKEVDEIAWVRPREARKMLTYPHDLDLLEAFVQIRDAGHLEAGTLVLLRHAKAAGRRRWRGDDAERPLTEAGVQRAEAVAALLAPYGLGRLIASTAVRCRQSLEPLAAMMRSAVEIDRRLGETSSPVKGAKLVRTLIDSGESAVLCSHLPLLSALFDAAGIKPLDLAPGEGVVLHHHGGHIVATERLTT